MAALPERQNSTVAAIFQHYEKTAATGQRPHLGASEIGHECERYLWLSFRWAKQPEFDGRMLRLFATGNHQEPRLVADLKAIGIEVSEHDENGKQWSFDAIGGHFGGSMDGAGLGFPEAPKTWHVLEFKTANAKSYAAMQKNGVLKSKPVHYAQMQLYMGWAKLDRAMYIVVNKDTDDIYTERVEFSRAEFEKLLAKAERAITSSEPPITLSETADYFVCRYCRFKDQCYGTEAPQVSCRTCAHATPETDGNARWSCAQGKPDMTVAAQRSACGEHRHIPVLLGRFAELMDATSNNLLTYRNKINGNEFHQPIYTSKDITNLEDKSLLGDAGLTSLKQEFDGDITKMPNDLPWEQPKASVRK